MNDDDDPISQWLADLKSDDLTAQERLWERYFHRVTNIARKHLGWQAHGPINEEDVAQSVFRTFFLRARDGKFQYLEDRRNLWGLLVKITIRKAVKQKRRELRQPEAADESELIQQVLSKSPDPADDAVERLAVQGLIDLLDPFCQRLVQFVYEGLTNEEAASALGVSVATIERKRKLIREIWRRAEGQ